MDRRRRRGKQRLQLLPPALERFAAQIPVALAKQVEEHDGRRNLLGQKLYARRSRMKAELQRVEIQPVSLTMTISPSSTQRAGNCDRNGSSSSGK